MIPPDRASIGVKADAGLITQAISGNLWSVKTAIESLRFKICASVTLGNRAATAAEIDLN